MPIKIEDVNSIADIDKMLDELAIYHIDSEVYGIIEELVEEIIRLKRLAL